MSHLYLIGFLESGNVTLGKQLAESLQRPFCNADELLAKRIGANLVDAYQKNVDAFYQSQHDNFQVIANIAEPQVVMVGDNATLRQADWELFENTGTTVYIQHTAERLFWRLRHDPKRAPLVDVLEQERRERIETMMKEREPAYLKSNHVISCQHEEVPDIIKQIHEKLAPTPSS